MQRAVSKVFDDRAEATGTQEETPCSQLSKIEHGEKKSRFSDLRPLVHREDAREQIRETRGDMLASLPVAPKVLYRLRVAADVLQELDGETPERGSASYTFKDAVALRTAPVRDSGGNGADVGVVGGRLVSINRQDARAWNWVFPSPSASRPQPSCA
ncbi:hypothetical protein MKZ38_006741 [Zalerion maritima]|uniref:Uncharacterized protein n=1 Tax=Zalerion maritima TaxID=339359 RepID=A0AAD5WPI0_9PEZI|nr:hypothetical protein MKZ38_006741 [Zalerion maritima]